MDQLDDREAALLHDLLYGDTVPPQSGITEACVTRVEDAADEHLETERWLQQAVWPARRTVAQLPSSFFPLVSEESRLARRLAACSVVGRREIERRRVVTEAMLVRDIAWEALRRVLPRGRRADVDALVASDETPESLSRSLDALAALVDRMLADAADEALVAASELDASYVAALRRHAAVLRASHTQERRTRQLVELAREVLRADAVARAAERRGGDGSRRDR